MSGWMSYLTGRPGTSRDRAKDAIIDLRSHLLLLEKKEANLMKKIEDEENKAKANVTTNKRGELLDWATARRRRATVTPETNYAMTVALAALRQKKLYEGEMDKLQGRRMTLETQARLWVSH